jgi:hypothetical protein
VALVVTRVIGLIVLMGSIVVQLAPDFLGGMLCSRFALLHRLLELLVCGVKVLLDFLTGGAGILADFLFGFPGILPRFFLVLVRTSGENGGCGGYCQK